MKLDIASQKQLLSEHILHVDMDAFFVSVERRGNPALKNKPVIVGGLGNRGVVASASYEARRFGVHAAMPIGRARRICPHATFLAPDIEAYRRESRAIFRIFGFFTPLVEEASLDEAFLDVSGARRLFGDAANIAHLIRRRIETERQLPASVGIATNKLVAKIASRAAKPDGVFAVAAGRENEFLAPLAVNQLWGVGSVAVNALQRLGVGTIGDLAAIPSVTLERAFGRNQGQYLHAMANGRDDSPLVIERIPKSIGTERTFETDIHHDDRVGTELLAMADYVAARLRKERFWARTITLKCRLSNFQTLTRATTVPSGANGVSAIYGIVHDSYRRLDLASPQIRLLGVTASGLKLGKPSRQLGFETEPDWDALMQVTDAVRARFGGDSLKLARLLRARSP